MKDKKTYLLDTYFAFYDLYKIRKKDIPKKKGISLYGHYVEDFFYPTQVLMYLDKKDDPEFILLVLQKLADWDPQFM